MDNNLPRSRRSTVIRHAQSRQSMSTQDERDGRPRIDTQRSRHFSPDQFEARFPRFHPNEESEYPPVANETTRLVSRDFAASPSRNRQTEFSLPPPSLRRRVGSGALSVSPGPSHSWRSFYDKKGTVAVAATSGRDHDSASHNFTLAGPPPLETLAANQNYVDPGYATLNPAYDQPSNVRPVWSLAKPLPHVLRPGMVPEREELKRMEDKQRALDDEETPEEHADLEAGRIEPDLRLTRVQTQLSQLASVRRERELHLFEAFQQQHGGTPGQSPFGVSRRRASTVSTEGLEHAIRRQTPIEEEGSEDQAAYDRGDDRLKPRQVPSEVEFPQLREAIAHVKQAQEEDEEVKAPYEDAVPLLAYQAEEDEVHNLHTYWSVIRLRFRDPLAEFIAVMVMDICGMSTNIAVTISRGAWGTGDTANWVWGFGCTMAVYVAGGVSGAHLNPATSLMLYVYRGFPLYKVFIYLPAQFCAIFLSSLLTFSLFKDGILEYAREEAISDALALGNATITAAAATLSSTTSSTNATTIEIIALPSKILSCFISFPRHSWVTFRTAYLTEMIGTCVMTITVLALGDDTNAPPGAGMSALIVGIVVTVVSMALAYNTGLHMNPIRDLAPRLMLTALGYGSSGPDATLFSNGYWFNVAWLGPLTGVMLGGFLYDAAIFVGGESPVNYPTRRIRRAARKWKKRWTARMSRRKKRRGEAVKSAGGSRYGST